MDITELLKIYSAAPQVKALAKSVGQGGTGSTVVEGLQCSAAPVVFAAMNSVLPACSTLLFIMQDADEAGYFYHDLMQLLSPATPHPTPTTPHPSPDVLFFPSSYRRAVKYGQRDAASEILRTEVLAKLNEPAAASPTLYIVTYPEAVAELVVEKRQLGDSMLTIRQGDTVDVDNTIDRLRALGFREVDYVYEPGQFALRGSILDVYSFSSELPFRIDFFGDDVDSLRTFEVETQLSKDTCRQVEIVPQLIGGEHGKVAFTSFLPESTVIVAKSMAYVCDTVERIYNEGFSQQAMKERLESATEQEQREILQAMNKEAMLISGSRFAKAVMAFKRIEMGHHPTSITQHPSPNTHHPSPITFNISPQPLFHKNFDLLKQSLAQSIADGYTINILADSRKQLDRLREIVGSDLNFIERTLHDGFVDHDRKLCVYTDHQIFDRYHKYSLRSDKARSGKVALTLKEIQQFEIGDYVVHIDHGIGKFGGLVRMPISSAAGGSRDGAFQEMIKIIYDGGGAIYVSIHSLYKVSKYKAQDGGQPPRLSHLGTGQWERMKERTKQKLKDIARDLIKLYAARRQQKGFAFSADSFMQHELEASFLYEDTPDQLKATQDVKADMESSRPMDRLVCGDVGFGKTEVAVRAAFKAASDSKQVAVLVPTTVLAYQHYQTFSSRLKDMPVRVEYLSRARTAKQTKAILTDLADGKIDIVIGTHKLIGKAVKFHDLGLLIIDEEQKFGVATKEKLRQMKTSVDTMTMSATPIPRTLQFSLVGARDLSIIQTPPPNRHPIQTEIHVFGAEIIADAIGFELSRNGQVYVVCPRINELTHVGEIIAKYVPDARVAVGHGQMKPDELEQIIIDFQNHDFDVLLSTTIIENGIDIPNANTIIICGAHHFGLSDLHQMRGRVGRSDRKAFCYLLAPPLAALPVESRRRLEALEQYSDLGSGIHIAMQDLDIRGAGNLLGAEQSGFIADLGYETYVKILNQAVTELRNENHDFRADNEDSAAARQGSGAKADMRTIQSSFVSDCSLDSDLEMFFPDSYVPSDSERMLLYRELDSLQTDAQLAAYRTRLIDRFGKVPHEGEELMRVVPLRRYGKAMGCEKLVLKQGRMTMFFVANTDSPFYQSEAFDRLLSFVAANPRRCQFRETGGKRSMVVADIPTVEAAVQLLSSM